MPALSMFVGRSGRGGVLRRLRRDDAGAVATVFAVVLAGGVLLGMLALTVDVGRLYAEREELQSGADAAVMAIAEKCARAQVSADCQFTDLQELAGDFADFNARDGSSNALDVCGHVPVSDTVQPCSDPIGNLTDCIPGDYTEDPSYSEDRPYLEVRTKTLTPSGDLLLPPSFAQTLLGNGDYEGTEVRACARATWGAPKRGLAVTFSLCEWNAATAGGTDFPQPPPYPPNTPPYPPEAENYEVVLKTHDSQTRPAECNGTNPGGDEDGGFGWLLDEDGTADCAVDEFNADPGNDVDSECMDELDATIAEKGLLYIPIFDEAIIDGQGKLIDYTIVGMAAFVPTGYYFSAAPTKQSASWLTGQDYCTGQERCIYGYFVDVLQAVGPISDTLESLGATVISVIG